MTYNKNPPPPPPLPWTHKKIQSKININLAFDLANQNSKLKIKPKKKKKTINTYQYKPEDHAAGPTPDSGTQWNLSSLNTDQYKPPLKRDMRWERGQNVMEKERRETEKMTREKVVDTLNTWN